MADFVKRSDIDFVAQLNTFKTKLPTYATLFGLTLAQTDAVNADADWLSFVVLRNNGVPGFAQDWTKLKKQVRNGGDGTIIPPFPVAPDVSMPPKTTIQPDVEGRFRMLVGQLKAHNNWSKAIGEDLGVEAAETSFDAENYKPEGSAKAVLSDVTIKCKKAGVDGVAIYSKVTTGAAVTIPGSPSPAPPTPAQASQFTKIAVDYHSPYLDNRPLTIAGQPELREYYLRGIIDDEMIGVPGDVIRVSVGTV